MAGDIVTVYGLLRQGDHILLQKRQTQDKIGSPLPPDEAHFSLFPHCKTPKGVFLNFFFEVSNRREAPFPCKPHKASHLAFFYADNLPDKTLDHRRQANDCRRRGIMEPYWGW